MKDAERETELGAGSLPGADRLNWNLRVTTWSRRANWSSGPALFPSPSLQTVAPSLIWLGQSPKPNATYPACSPPCLPTACVALLREDAAYIASVATVEQAAEMAGVSEGVLTGTDAMWSGSDEDRERQRIERERLRAAHGTTSVDALALLETERSGVPPLGSG